MKNRLIICLLGLFMSGFFAQNVSAQDEYMDGALYIKLKQGIVKYTKSPNRNFPIRDLLFNTKSQIADNYAIKEFAFSMHIFDNEKLDNVFRLEFDSLRLTEQLMEELKKDDRIEFIERVPAQILQVVVPEEDPVKTFLNMKDDEEEENENITNDFFWGMIDGVHTSWFLDVIGYREIYGKYEGNSDLRVAIIDNAVWNGHEDYEIEYDDLYDTTVSIEGEANPPSTINQNSEAAYQWSHGTHCAGLIGAFTNNEKGIPAIASGVTLMGVRVAQNNPLEMPRSTQGVIWAADNGAKVISMSFGNRTQSDVEREVFESLIDNGVVLVASAGNDGANRIYYPANYRGVISVAAVNSDLKRSSFSNYGSWVDIGSPGGYYVRENGTIDESSQIFSTTFCSNYRLQDKSSFRGKHYDMMAGTSMAAPLVSSLVSLVKSYYPDLNGYQVLEVLQRSSTKVSQNNLPITANSGVINAPAAMSLIENSQDKYVTDLKADYFENAGEIVVSWDVPKDSEGVTGYSIYKNETLVAEGIEELSYTIEAQNMTGLYGVKALYEGEDGLIVYTQANPASSIRNTNSNTILNYYVSDKTLFLSAANEINSVAIFDVHGRLLIETGYNSGVNISSLKRGIYILKAKYNGGESHVKFIL